MKLIDRREFLKTSLSGLALATLPVISFSQSNPDIVVIGAGAAGLSATAFLFKLNSFYYRQRMKVSSIYL